ncbi:MAG: hypothetical protein ABI134_01065 [Byssovorax sp.]
MSKNNLTSPTMVTVTTAWTDPKEERPLLASLPQAGALLPSIDKAHRGLLDSQTGASQTNVKLTALQKAQAVLDVRHDRQVRGKYHVLTGFAELADNEEEAAAYLALRDALTPRGLDTVRLSYTDEAGEAELTDRRLTKDDKALLGKLPTPNGTLLDALKARLKAGRELGDLEKQRAALESQAPAATTPADAVRARNVWIRTVNAFVGLLDLEEGLSEADRETILGPLRRAEQKADRKRAGSAEADPVEAAPVDPKAADPAADAKNT